MSATVGELGCKILIHRRVNGFCAKLQLTHLEQKERNKRIYNLPSRMKYQCVFNLLILWNILSIYGTDCPDWIFCPKV
jgi:hypothetical protein